MLPRYIYCTCTPQLYSCMASYIQSTSAVWETENGFNMIHKSTPGPAATSVQKRSSSSIYYEIIIHISNHFIYTILVDVLILFFHFERAINYFDIEKRAKKYRKRAKNRFQHVDKTTLIDVIVCERKILRIND